MGVLWPDKWIGSWGWGVGWSCGDRATEQSPGTAGRAGDEGMDVSGFAQMMP